MVVVVSAHLPTEPSLLHARVPLSATEALLSQDACAWNNCHLHCHHFGDIYKRIYLGPRNHSAL